MLGRRPTPPPTPWAPPGYRIVPAAPRYPLAARGLVWALRLVLSAAKTLIVAAVKAMVWGAGRAPYAAAGVATTVVIVVAAVSGQPMVAVVGVPAMGPAWVVAWAKSRRPKPDPTPPVEDARVALWRTLIGLDASAIHDPDTGVTVHRAGGPLPGCSVSSKVEEDLDSDGRVVRFRLRVQGRGVDQHVGTIRGKAAEIAAAYSTYLSAVTVEPDGQHGRAVVEIVPADAHTRHQAAREERLMTVHRMTGTHLDLGTGLITIGHLADTGAPMQVTLWRPGNGVRHSWFPGATGSGKSALVSSVLTSACQKDPATGGPGLVCPHIADLAGGASLPEWEGVATSFVTDVPAAIGMLRRIERLYEARVDYMRAHRATCLDPSPLLPIHTVVVEESPEMAANSEAMRIVDRLVRLGRKCLISVCWVSQSGDAVKVFGNAGTSMRQQLKAGNIVALFLTGESIGQVLSGARDTGDTAFDPSSVTVPKDTPGACVAWTPSHETPVLGRAWWFADDYRPTMTRELVSIPTDPMWQAIIDADQAADDADKAADKAAGVIVPPGVRGNARIVLETVLTHEVWRIPGVPVSTSELRRESGITSESSLSYALSVLVKRGQIVDLGYGQWSLPEDRKTA
jgi:hypothetical protein